MPISNGRITARALSACVVTSLGLTLAAPLRADAPRGRYELQACGTIVYDTKTGLEWQRSINDRRDVAFAAGVCGLLSLDGTGWRVPTMLELVSIQDATTQNPMIDSRAFPGTPSATFVTSTQPFTATTPPSYWVLSFGTGTPEVARSGRADGVAYSRCVRTK